MVVVTLLTLFACVEYQYDVPSLDFGRNCGRKYFFDSFHCRVSEVSDTYGKLFNLLSNADSIV